MSYDTLPSLLFHRGIPWQGSVRGSTNVIARLFLSAGYPITWLTRPCHIGHALFRENNLNQTQRFSSRSIRWQDGALEIDPFTMMPIIKSKFLGQSFWATSAQFGYRTIRPSLSSILQSAKQPQPDLIWSTGGDGSSLRRAFPNSKRIMQCVDIYEAYAGVTQNGLEKADYQEGDAIVTIGHALAAYLVRERGVPQEKITVIGQGADLELFSEKHHEPDDLAAIPHPRLIWVGVVDKADPELMNAALSALPVGEGSLVLIGPISNWALQLAKRDSRVHSLGSRPAHEAAAYLQHSDIGLMLYDRSRNPLQYEGQNPLKLYEMAAARLPIISTTHQEYQYMQVPALIADTPDAVAEAVLTALANKDNMSHESWAFAMNNGWRNRFEEAEKLVQHTLEIVL